jgi:hypothetical protein
MAKSTTKPNPTPPATSACTIKPKSLVEFIRESPLMGADLDLERDRDAGRDIEL